MRPALHGTLSSGLPVLVGLLGTRAVRADDASHAAPTVLFMPIEALAGVQTDTAAQITAYLVSQAATASAYRVIAFKEVEGTMSQEQLRQTAGCNAISCAAEIAGALNTDEIVIGTLGKIENDYLLTLSRVRARDAQVARRISDRFHAQGLTEILDRMPEIARRLMSDSPLAPGVETAPSGSAASGANGSPPPQSHVVEQQENASDGKNSPGPWRQVLQVSSAAGVGMALLLGAIVAGAWALVVAFAIMDRTLPGNGQHRLSPPMAVTADVVLGAAAVGVLLPALPLAAGVVLWVTSLRF